MAGVNIPKSTLDPFYRYKRNTLEIRLGKGNTTIVTNLPLIAGQLNRSTDQLVTYFRKALSCNIFSKGPDVIMGGQRSVAELEAVLEQYIEQHVVCSVCGNPETDGTSCRACGSN